MLEREPHEDGWQVRIPMTGVAQIVRLLPAAFLALWLCGWATGEYFVGGMLVAGLRDLLAPGMRIDWLPHVRAASMPAFALVFLGVWVAFWTAGGVFAIGSLVGLLFGVPIVRWNARHVDFVVEVGPFSRRRRVLLADIRGITPGPLGSLMIAGSHRRTPLGPFTDPSDIQQMAAWLEEARTQGAAEPDPMVAIG